MAMTQNMLAVCVMLSLLASSVRATPGGCDMPCGRTAIAAALHAVCTADHKQEQTVNHRSAIFHIAQQLQLASHLLLTGLCSCRASGHGELLAASPGHLIFGRGCRIPPDSIIFCCIRRKARVHVHGIQHTCCQLNRSVLWRVEPKQCCCRYWCCSWLRLQTQGDTISAPDGHCCVICCSR